MANDDYTPEVSGKLGLTC